MRPSPRVPVFHHLVWVCHASLASKLDAATWLQITKELRKLGWNVTLIAAGPNGKHTVGGVEVLGFAVPNVYLIRYLVFHARLLAFILRNWQNIDIVLFHPMSALWLLPLRLLRPLRGSTGPLVVMDTRDLDAPGGHGLRYRFRTAHGALVRRLAGGWADGQTAITERMAELVRIPRKQLWGTWPSGVNLEDYAPAQALRRWPGEAEPIRLVYTGTLLPERNLVAMCQAVEHANAAQMQFSFRLYGGGSSRAELEAFASGTAGRVSVCAPVPHEQIPSVLAQAHVGVTSLFFPNQALFQASSPIKLFEYMAAGMPILALRMPCHTDAAGDSPCVFWAETPTVEGLTAALRALWSQRATLASAGCAAAELSREYTWAASARKFALALEHGLAAKGNRGG